MDGTDYTINECSICSMKTNNQNVRIIVYFLLAYVTINVLLGAKQRKQSGYFKSVFLKRPLNSVKAISLRKRVLSKEHAVEYFESDKSFKLVCKVEYGQGFCGTKDTDF